MDAVYVFKHSDHGDIEIRYSLRSIERHAPYIRKVWIFGDRPNFLSDDCSVIEHVPHEQLASLFGFRTPVTNFFLMIFLSSLIPELNPEYLRFSDDFFLVKDFPIEEARKSRYSENLSMISTRKRKRGLWGDSLWHTHDFLLHLGYTGYNFEIHAPTYLTRKWVMDAYRDFRDYVSQDRWFGMLGATAILNHAHKHHGTELISIIDEGSRFGFWGIPPTCDEITRQSQGKTFFNFNEAAFGDGVMSFLQERFPTRSRYERDDS